MPPTAPTRPPTPTAADRLPLSRIEPVRELLELAGTAFCRSRGVLPLAVLDGAVLVAAVQPDDAAALAELEARLGRPLVVRAASPGDLAIALAAAAEGGPTSAHWRSALGDVLRTLQLLHEEHATAYALAAIDEPWLGAELVAAGLLSAEEQREAVALAFWLPAIALSAHPPTPDLDALLPAGLALSRRVLPVWVVRDTLFVGCDSPPDAALVEELRALTGFDIQPVLVAPDELSAALGALPATDAAAPLDIAPGITTLLGEGALAAAERVAAHTREPLAAVARRLHGLSDADLAAAAARAAGVPTYNAGRHGTARPALPRALRAAAGGASRRRRPHDRRVGRPRRRAHAAGARGGDARRGAPAVRDTRAARRAARRPAAGRAQRHMGSVRGRRPRCVDRAAADRRLPVSKRGRRRRAPPR